MNGKYIKRLNTLGTMYDHNCIAVTTRQGHTFRLDVKEFMKVIDRFDFDVEKKKVHSYLIINNLRSGVD